ncbi:MAG TPA: glycosyltransferase family 2 protein [Thermoanaerobaculia bacterium]|jgi:glycosyltransferase involved in cell wall biosynthesis|nr:glycosyltransferase family 2 protein [Thermoanaerobaculia bacterium]
MATVEIIIPVYNRAGLVGEAIDSALRAAPEVPVEVIVVDDASTDGTWDRVQAYDDPRIRGIRMEANGGQSAARNRGLEHARGDFVKFLDSDDVLIAGHLAGEVRVALRTGAEIVASGWCSESNGQTTTYAAPIFRSIIDDVLAGVAVPTSSGLYVRRPDWRWDPRLRKLDDWDYFCQAALRANAIATVDGAAYIMRDHSGPRMTQTSMLANSLEHHRILQKIEDRLSVTGQLTEARRRRLAQYFYKEMRVLSLYDRPAFEAAVRHILELDPNFQPRDEERQRWMRMLARVIGFRNAIVLHSAVKRRVRKR